MSTKNVYMYTQAYNKGSRLIIRYIAYKGRVRKIYKLLFILTFFILVSNVFPQEIVFNDNKLEFFFDSTLTIYDSITIYNTGSNLLEIDSIYSRNHYGYSVEIFLKDTTFFYFVFVGDYPLIFFISSNDSAKLIFHYPDFCPICKNYLETAAFSDILVFHSNSLSNKYTYILVEGDGSTDIKDDAILTDKFVLYQNYPNPFNPNTIIQYSIPKESFVNLIVYNVLGKEVATLVNNPKSAGNYSVDFNASNLPSGVYFYRMQAGTFVSTKKFVLLK